MCQARVIAYTSTPPQGNSVAEKLFAGVLEKPATPAAVLTMVQYVASLRSQPALQSSGCGVRTRRGRASVPPNPQHRLLCLSLSHECGRPISPPSRRCLRKTYCIWPVLLWHRQGVIIDDFDIYSDRAVAALRELVEALDRRVPHVERLGEKRIAREAAASARKRRNESNSRHLASENAAYVQAKARTPR